MANHPIFTRYTHLISARADPFLFVAIGVLGYYMSENDRLAAETRKIAAAAASADPSSTLFRENALVQHYICTPVPAHPSSLLAAAAAPSASSSSSSSATPLVPLDDSSLQPKDAVDRRLVYLVRRKMRRVWRDWFGAGEGTGDLLGAVRAAPARSKSA